MINICHSNTVAGRAKRARKVGSPGNAPESDPHPKSVGFKTGSTGKRKNTHRMSNEQGRRARWPPPRAEGARHRTSSYKKCILIKAVCQGVAQKEV